MNKKPVGHFRKDGQLVLVIPEDDQTADEAIKETAADHGIDPEEVVPGPPKEEEKPEPTVPVKEQGPGKPDPVIPEDVDTVEEEQTATEDAPSKTKQPSPPAKDTPAAESPAPQRAADPVRKSWPTQADDLINSMQ